MMSPARFRELALSFPQAREKPHFEKTAFFVKKIFASLDDKGAQACLLLTPEDQAAFCGIDAAAIYPAPNKWGLQGATIVELNKAEEAIVKDALVCAYIAKAPKLLAAPFIAQREEQL